MHCPQKKLELFWLKIKVNLNENFRNLSKYLQSKVVFSPWVRLQAIKPGIPGDPEVPSIPGVPGVPALPLEPEYKQKY